MSVERRALSGIVAGGANFIVTFGLVFIQVPILLRYWGAELYGVWNAIFAFYSLLITFDAGFQSYVGSIFLQTFHGNPQRLKRELGSGLRVAILLGCLQMVVAAAVVLFRLAKPMIGADPRAISGSELTISLVALILQWIVSGSVCGILVKIFSAGGHYTRATVWGIGNRILFSAALCSGAAISHRIWPAAVAVSATVTVYSFVQAWDLRRLFPELFPWWSAGSWNLGWRSLRESVVLTISGIVQQFSTNGLVLVVTHLLNSVAVALLSTLRTVANSAVQATLIVAQPILPDLIKYHAAGDGSKVCDTLASLWFVSGLVINLGLAVAIVVAPPFYEHWTRGRLAFDAALFAYLAIGVQVRNIASPFLQYLLGLNELRAQLRIALWQTGVTLALSALLMGEWGIKAAGIGILAGEVVSLGIAQQAAAGVLRRLSANFSWRMLRFAYAGLALNSAAYIGATLLPSHRLGMAAAAFAGASLLGTANWRALPSRVRLRITGLGAALLGRIASLAGASE